MSREIFMGREPSAEDWYTGTVDFSAGGISAGQAIRDLAYPGMVRAIYEHYFAGLTDESSMGEYLRAGAGIYRDNDALNRKLGIRYGGAVDDGMVYNIAGQILHVFSESPVLEYWSQGHLAEKILDMLGTAPHGPMLSGGEKLPHEIVNDQIERKKMSHARMAERYGCSMPEMALLRGGKVPYTKDILYTLALALRMPSSVFRDFALRVNPAFSFHSSRDKRILANMDHIRLLESIQPDGQEKTPVELINQVLENSGEEPVDSRVCKSHTEPEKEAVLITGGRGFIGQHCVSYFKDQYRVCILSSGNGPTGDIPDGVRFYTGSLADPLVYERILAENSVNYIIHLAAIPIPKDAAGRLGDAFSLNAQAVNVLCDVITKNSFPVKGLIFPSTENVYRGAAGKYTESAQIDERKLEPYAWSKYVAEEAIWKYVSGKGLRACIVRLSNIYGPGDAHTGKRLVPRTISLLSQNRSPETMTDADGKAGEIDLLYVKDLVKLFGRIIGHMGSSDVPFHGEDIIFNAGSGALADIRTVQEIIRSTMGKEFVPIKEIRSGTRSPERQAMSLAKTENMFGTVAKTSLADGIRETIRETIKAAGNADKRDNCADGLVHTAKKKEGNRHL